MPESMPAISVLMPVYNAAPFLREAVDSILSQNMKDFEFIIIDDGSTDGSPDIIRGYADPRIRFVSNEANIGLAKSLNKGVQLCQGRYIARMDADDVADIRRLHVQFEFMESNPLCVVCGTAVIVAGEGGAPWRLGKTDSEIRAWMLFDSPIVHPSAFIRRCVLTENGICYDENFRNSQDYDLWYRLSRYGCLANIDVPLLQYRIHAAQTNKSRQRLFANEIRGRILVEALGLEPASLPGEYFQIFESPETFDAPKIDVLMAFFRLMEARNAQSGFVDPVSLRFELLRRLSRIIRQSVKLGPVDRSLYLLKALAIYCDVKVCKQLFDNLIA